MQGKSFVHLELDAAVAVNDTFRGSGRTGGEQHPQRMVERNRGRAQFGCALNEIGPLQEALIVGEREPGPRDHDGVPGMQGCVYLGDCISPVADDAAEAVAVGGDQHLRGQLGEPGERCGWGVVLSHR